MTESIEPSSINSAEAMLELTLLNAETVDASFDDVFVASVSKGISPEILTRMRDLWETSKVIGNEVVQIGKIIVLKLVEFLNANPRLAASLALGAAVYFLSHAIPFIGPLLAPLLSALTTVMAIFKGSSFDDIV